MPTMQPSFEQLQAMLRAIHAPDEASLSPHDKHMMVNHFTHYFFEKYLADPDHNIGTLAMGLAEIRKHYPDSFNQKVQLNKRTGLHEAALTINAGDTPLTYSLRSGNFFKADELDLLSQYGVDFNMAGVDRDTYADKLADRLKKTDNAQEKVALQDSMGAINSWAISKRKDKDWVTSRLRHEEPYIDPSDDALPPGYNAIKPGGSYTGRATKSSENKDKGPGHTH